MKKTRRNRTFALEILREEKRRTIFWFTAFIVAFTVVVIDRIFGKVGINHE